MDSRGTGLLLIATGVALAIPGWLILGGGLSFFGKLPGDIRYEGEHTRVHVPLSSMLLVSVLLNMITALARRFV